MAIETLESRFKGLDGHDHGWVGRWRVWSGGWFCATLALSYRLTPVCDTPTVVGIEEIDFSGGFRDQVPGCGRRPADSGGDGTSRVWRRVRRRELGDGVRGR